ncbi:MAG TPA: type II secretion system secretin GspD, partial [Nitrospinota bacterium]|nr:type II secretion system secretin GspD [Nitrospinota bacterium]
GPYYSGKSEVGDRMTTRLIPLNYIMSDEMVNVLRPLIPVSSFITSYASTNTLILVDLASNADKIIGIIKQLDVAGHEEELTVMSLKYAGAKELAERLSKIFKGDKRSTSRRKPTPGSRSSLVPVNIAWSNTKARVIPDERVNALIVMATKFQTKRIRSLVKKLDIRPPAGQGKINVYYLKNADAEKLSKVLNQLTGKVVPISKKPTGNRNPSSINLQSEVFVTPDKASNSLVIAASREDYSTIREVIEKLDKRRKQVFVEALIMEITTDKSREFGVEWRATADFNDGSIVGIGGTNFGNINKVAENPFDAPPGITIGVVDGIINFGGQNYLNIGALLYALQKESGINILSTPNLLTTDNEEAEIVVAQNVPFITGQSQNTGGTTLTTIERKNIGITLKIKPQISASDTVKLDVFQEISSISPTQIDKAQDLITFTRSVKTTVTVNNKQNIVIGGLIRDDFNEIESKVPFFGDIPGLGWLFKNQSKQKQKTNLLIFLTPHIINSSDDIKHITEKQNRIMRVDDEKKNTPFEAPLTTDPLKKKEKKKKETGFRGSFELDGYQ